MKRIEHIVEPERLLLAWQAPEGTPDRSRCIVAELARWEGGVVFRYLKNSPDFEKAQRLGFAGHPAFKLAQEEHTSGILDVFLRRIPPRSRSDFSKYLEWLLLPENTSELSDLALLGYSGAALPSDGFSLIHPFDRVNGPCEFLLEVAGFRHQKNVSLGDVREGMRATFESEPENPYDPLAVRIMAGGKRIGYVNRGQTNAFHFWFEQGQRIDAVVERKNGRPDRPLVYLFVQVKAPIASINVA